MPKAPRTRACSRPSSALAGPTPWPRRRRAAAAEAAEATAREPAEPRAAAPRTTAAPEVAGAPAEAPSSGAVAPAGGQGQGSLRARLNRQRLARRAALRAPDWIRRLDRDSRLSEAQVDSYYIVLRRHLRRIVVDDLSVRVDIFIVDMADAAGGGRMQARRFLVDLLKDVEARADDAALDWYARAGERLELETGTVRAFVEALGGRSRRLFEDRRAATSDQLLRKAAGEAELSRPQARRLLAALAGIDEAAAGR